MTMIESAKVSVFLWGGATGIGIGASVAGPLGALAGAVLGSLAGCFGVSVLLLATLAALTVADWWNHRHSAALLRRLLAAPPE